MKQVLSLITAEMKKASVDYHFMKNKKSKPTYPYFVGELLPTEPTSEDGMKEFTLVIDGFNRGTIFNLLEETEKIEQHFPSVEGLIAMVGNQAIAIFSNSPQVVDSGDEELQKIQINLTVKTWKGGN